MSSYVPASAMAATFGPLPCARSACETRALSLYLMNDDERAHTASAEMTFPSARQHSCKPSPLAARALLLTAYSLRTYGLWQSYPNSAHGLLTGVDPAHVRYLQAPSLSEKPSSVVASSVYGFRSQLISACQSHISSPLLCFFERSASPWNHKRAWTLWPRPPTS